MSSHFIKALASQLESEYGQDLWQLTRREALFIISGAARLASIDDEEPGVVRLITQDLVARFPRPLTYDQVIELIDFLTQKEHSK